MRVLHVLPSYSRSGQSGGPARVALEQTRVLRESGHSVTLIAPAADGSTRNTEGVLTFVAQRIAPLGTAGITSASLLFWFLLNARRFDRVHLHFSRDLTTVPIGLLALLFKRHLIVQTHGMLDASTRFTAKILDFLATRIILRKARAVIALSERENDDLREVVGPRLAPVHIQANTVQYQKVENTASAVDPEICFLARMHARKRPELFIEAAIRLVQAGWSASFSLIGPDEGAIVEPMKKVMDLGLADRIIWEGPLEPSAVIHRLSSAYTYVLPATNEPFGLTLVEAMLAGAPVVLSADAVLAEAVVRADAGSVFDGTPQDLARVIAEYISDPALRLRQSENAQVLAKTRYSSDGLASSILNIYGPPNGGSNAEDQIR